MPDEDTTLMLAVREGSRDAFDELVLRYRKPLERFFRRMMSDAAAAEDAAQEVFCRIYLARERYEPRARFKTYLFRIATNYWIDQYRKTTSRPASLSLDARAAGKEEEGGTLADRLPGNEVLPPDRAVRKEDLGRLDSAIRTLPPHLRAVLNLNLGEQLPYQEIAEALDIPVGTVKSRMNAALEHLRKTLRQPESPAKP